MFIVMACYEGQSLKDKIERGPIPLQDAVDYSIQIASGLSEAHKHGIVHRDIKSENVFITNNGVVKILDFGLAKLGEKSQLTKENSTIGTLSYMSPEQIEGMDVDSRSDIFSFGVVFYEMLAGELPFKGDHASKVIFSILNDEPQPLRDLPLDIVNIVEKALRKQAKKRYQHIDEMLSELKTNKENSFPVKTKDSHTIKRVSLIGMMIAIIMIVFFFIYKTNLNKTILQISPIVTRLTSYPNIENYPALSADGSKLAFSWNGEKGDNTDIYIKLIRENAYVRFTRDPAKEFSATWSGDGNYLAYIRSGENGSSIYRKSIIGDRETKVADIYQTEMPYDMEPRVDWSPDVQWLVFNDYDSLHHTNCLFRLNLDSGEREQITFSAPGLVGDMNPKFSPDGNWVAFERTSGDRISELYLLNLKKGTLKQLTYDKKQIDDLSWSADGQKIVFVSKREGISRLWKLDISGGQPKPLDIGGIGAAHISISRIGHCLAYATMNHWADIWQAEIPEDSGLIKPSRLINSLYVDNFPMYSPNEQKIAFNSDRSGNSEIYVCNQDGSDAVRITFLETHSGVPRWSPSGEFIIFDSRYNGNSDIMIVDAHEPKQPLNLTNHPADDRIASWSRDGRYIYFGSKRTGDYQIYKMSADGGESVQITKRGGFWGFESFDSACFYYKKYEEIDGPIYQINLKTLEESVAIEENVNAFRWSVEKDGIYYIAADKDNNPILKLIYHNSGRVKKLGTFEKLFWLWDVSYDGTHILLWRREGLSGDIYMVNGFHL